MSGRREKKGFAIAIAWPETHCKQAGDWWDGLLNCLNISNNHFYRVGHAALVLVDATTSTAHYFDFGRYHAPFKHGRVRSQITDNGLAIHTTPVFSEDRRQRTKDRTQVENFEEILSELQGNSECHGDGPLYASYCEVDFQKSFSFAKELQQQGPVRYGPFTYNGSNCSRFVCDAILAGKPKRKYAFKLRFLLPLTPTPMTNVQALKNKITIPSSGAVTPFFLSENIDKQFLNNTLTQPIRHPNIPASAQWLSGEGAGSWFVMEQDQSDYHIRRYNQNGSLECKGRFRPVNQATFSISAPFTFEHISHCLKVRLQQNAKYFELHRVG